MLYTYQANALQELLMHFHFLFLLLLHFASIFTIDSGDMGPSIWKK